MNELKEIYDEKLGEALTYSPFYKDLRNIDGINEHILTKDFIVKYLKQIKEICFENKNTLSTEGCRQNILMTINDMRFNYSFKNNKEKELLYEEFNDCIYLLNNVEILENQYSHEKQFELRVAREILKDMEFRFVHYYLTDYNVFLEEGVPLFFLQNYYLIMCYSIIVLYPNILGDEEFLKRTNVIIKASLEPEKYIENYEYDEMLEDIKPEFYDLQKRLSKKAK